MKEKGKITFIFIVGLAISREGRLTVLWICNHACLTNRLYKSWIVRYFGEAMAAIFGLDGVATSWPGRGGHHHLR